MCALITATDGNPFRRKTRTESDWGWFGRLGADWLNSHGCSEYTAEQARGTGYGRAIYQETNPEPGRIKTVTQAVHSGEIESVTIHSDHAARMKRWRQARDSWLADYVMTEFGLAPTPKEIPVEIDREKQAVEYVEKKLGKPGGKAGEKARGIGKRFSREYQPKR